MFLGPDALDDPTRRGVIVALMQNKIAEGAQPPTPATWSTPASQYSLTSSDKRSSPLIQRTSPVWGHPTKGSECTDVRRVELSA